MHNVDFRGELISQTTCFYCRLSIQHIQYRIRSQPDEIAAGWILRGRKEERGSTTRKVAELYCIIALGLLGLGCIYPKFYNLLLAGPFD